MSSTQLPGHSTLATLEKGSVESLTTESIAHQLLGALGQLRFIRAYFLELVNSVPKERWKEIPNGSPSNIAWQVGHVAVAEYGLLLFRQRGRAEEDLDLMPGWLRKKYGKGSKPSSDLQESPDELLDALHRIHERSLACIESLALSQFLDPIDMPYAAYPNKLGAVLFCPLHESIHCGQVGVLRRLLGCEPIR